MALSVFWIILGTVLIAGGGLLATYGWNQYTTAGQRRDLIRAVAAELFVNTGIFSDPDFQEQDEAKLGELVLFPRMQITALGAAIASALFVGEKDRVFFSHAVLLHRTLEDFNQRVAVTEQSMMRDPRQIAFLRKRLRDGQTLKGTGSRLARFGTLLMSDYGIKPEDRFFVEIEN